ncbi:ABC transporter ATP-binding protein/permease [Roseibacterium beibuensis]|uniref:ABC transporter ATP-binding protein n=1 Tax=[Roseibacterium] beibuensis TaxID=1193142 RepID=A0ABP9KZ61_9RHOB|nr:ABC transporter ATP-binding protein [Roseibacterium beibuensis]MCS6622095.1 ABC transporter ATP-binding protein/permease [Roseibacterium beibuensis]
MSARQSLDIDVGADMPGLGLVGRFWREHVVQHWPMLVLATMLMSVEGAALGAFAWLIQPLFDDFFAAGEMDGVVWIAILIAGLFLVRALAGFFQRLIVVTIGLKVTMALQSRLVSHLLTLDQRFFQDNSPGALIERVRGDTLSLQGVASGTLMSLGRDAISMVSLLAVMLWTDWQWTLLALFGIPLLVLPLLAVQRYIRKTTRRAREAASNLSNRLDEIFHGIQTIKLNRLEEHEDSRFARETRRFLKPSVKAQAGSAANPALIDLVAAAGFVVVVYFGGSQIISGEKTMGEFMSFFTALGLLFEPLRRLSSISARLQTAMASLERLYAALDARPSVLPPVQPEPMPAGDIAFEDVSFAYGDATVLHGLSFHAEAGKTTALVGPSGAGKTTVFALLTRLIDPLSGRISIGDMPVERIDLGALRRSIAVVGQETALFDEGIADNIRMGRLDASDAEVMQAARDASVLEFAETLPDGLDTQVGPRGSGLSGGQRQRVAIARALLKSAPILLLDEPTSALDARSEQLVQQALDRLAEGRTTLVIAHRLSTIREADKIVVMEEGRVVEEGAHDELLARKGAYWRLHQLQAAGIDPNI